MFGAVFVLLLFCVFFSTRFSCWSATLQAYTQWRACVRLGLFVSHVCRSLQFQLNKLKSDILFINVSVYLACHCPPACTSIAAHCGTAMRRAILICQLVSHRYMLAGTVRFGGSSVCHLVRLHCWNTFKVLEQVAIQGGSTR